MKKILALLTAASIATVSGVSALAADKEKGEPDVIVDGSKIIFEDQNAKIVDDVTLVPARGVFEAMDCKVDWNGTDRTVTVTSSTGVREVVITIDSKTMKVSTFKSLMEKENTEYELEVPAQIINDRTMIPLRAVSEAFDSEVAWDWEAYAVIITAGNPILLEGFTYTAPEEDSLVKMSISTDYEGLLKAGDEFNVYITAENVPVGTYCSGVVCNFIYDKTKVEYITDSGIMITDGDISLNADMSDENTDMETGIRIMYVKVLENTGRTSSGKVYSCKFRAITDGPCEISIGNDYTPPIGYASYLMFTGNDSDVIYDGKNLNLDTTPITIGE